MEKVPIITSKTFSILEADQEGESTWKVKAKMGDKVREFVVHGSPEDVLKKVSSSDRVCPFHLRVFLSNLQN